MVSIGKIGQDTFLSGPVFKPSRIDGVAYEKIRLGEKFYVDDAVISTGGNAGNASVTFARQGLASHFIGVVGGDPAGQIVLKALDDDHVDTARLRIERTVRTSFSTILLAPTGERTILDYPGTAKIIEADLELPKNTDWLYVSSLGSMKLLKKLMKRAHADGIKVAFNPASFELKHLQESAELLNYVELLAVNKEEAQLFTHGETTKQLARKLSESVRYVLVSDGPRGAVATDGIYFVKAGIYEDVPVVDRTGAGDAFTSGFVVQIALGYDLEKAITFASANSTSVVSQIGAKAGILHSNSKLHDMPLQVSQLQ